MRCKAEFAAVHPTLTARGGCASVRLEAGNGYALLENCYSLLQAFNRLFTSSQLMTFHQAAR